MGEHSAQKESFIPTLLPWLTATQSLNDSAPTAAANTNPHTTPRRSPTPRSTRSTATSPPAATRTRTPCCRSTPTAAPSTTQRPTRLPYPSGPPCSSFRYQAYWSWDKDADNNRVYDYRDAEKDPSIADRHLNWIRAFYEDVYDSTGHVPAVADPALPASLSAHTDGCYVNYPDTDLDDPGRNTSGQSSHRLYYKDNYARLQRTSSAGIPTTSSRHAQSIRLPTSGSSSSGAKKTAGSKPGPPYMTVAQARECHRR
ncbi:BBE domain-containing protein [Streptomyces thinghirensis]|nr:BBE domain-containing protein [Streptomyces thinghirensis]